MWQEAVADGPLGPEKKIPEIMLKLKKKETWLIETLVRTLKEWLEPLLRKSSAKMIIALWGGGAGSEPFIQHIREELESEGVKITVLESIYPYVAIRLEQLVLLTIV